VVLTVGSAACPAASTGRARYSIKLLRTKVFRGVTFRHFDAALVESAKLLEKKTKLAIAGLFVGQPCAFVYTRSGCLVD
jgi:hypothetical protein